MARFRVHIWGLATTAVLVIALAGLSVWQEGLLPVQAAQGNFSYVMERGKSFFSNATDSAGDFQSLAETSANLSADLAGGVEPTTTPESISMQEAMSSAEAEFLAMFPEAQLYTVKAGDSLVSIAQKFRVDLDELAAINGLKRNSGLYKRQVLMVPVRITMAPVAAPVAAAEEKGGPAVEATAEVTADAPTPAAEEKGGPAVEATAEVTATEEMSATTEAAIVVTPSNMQETMAAAEAEFLEMFPEVKKIYIVEAGDSLMTVANDFNVDVNALATANGLSPNSTLYKGLAIIIPTNNIPAPAATPIPAGEEKGGPAAEPTAEAATEEATAEPTAETMAEPTVEMTEEATPEATEELTEEAMGEADIIDTLVSLGNFQTMVSLLEAANLTETVRGEGPFTIFAATDAAFAALPEGTIDGLLATAPEDLSQLLRYHVLFGRVLSSEFVDGMEVATVQGSMIEITADEQGIMANNANITIADIETSNGIIHVIDAVLLPPDMISAVPSGATATSPEAASMDAASVIIVPAPTTANTSANAAHIWSEPNSNIVVFSPVDAGGYHSPVEVIGLSQTAEGNVSINLVRPDGALLGQRTTLGGALDYAFFQTHLRFSVSEVTTATLNVVETDMADGTILTTISVPITLLPGQRVIDVTTPGVGQALCDQILVSAYSNTFEANVVLTLSTPEGEILVDLPATGGTLGTYRDFAMLLPYEIDEATPLLVSVTETDASGRFPSIDQTVVPVTLYPAYSAACY